MVLESSETESVVTAVMEHGKSMITVVLESDHYHTESVLTVVPVHRLFGVWFKCYIVF